MDQQINQPQIELEKLFNELASLGNLSESHKQELFPKLEGAIASNIISKLLEQLQENDRKLLEQKDFKTNEELFSFLSRRISQEDFRKVASLSVEEVVKKFLGKI